MAGNQEFQITYKGGDGNDVVVTAVPEPGAAGLLAAAALCIRRRTVRRARNT